jgi:2-polyprenyl-6-hydroxyphenyl methylase/3-demethylubiquinone-9 3-methyltransferase
MVDANSDPRFVDYYEAHSASEAAVERARLIKGKLLRFLARLHENASKLDVVDVGCGAGTQSFVWTEEGHAVRGLDVSAPLVEIARQRAQERGLDVRFDVGTATKLPYADRSADVCLLPELLEHIQDWQACLDEAVRILRRGGVLFVSTTNALCPVQDEFNLPLYSWYPRPLKRYCERLAVTTRREWVQFTSYPAVNWFTYAELSSFLTQRGMMCYDRLDMLEIDPADRPRALAVSIAKKLAPLRYILQLGLVSNIVVAMRET